MAAGKHRSTWSDRDAMRSGIPPRRSTHKYAYRSDELQSSIGPFGNFIHFVEMLVSAL